MRSRLLVVSLITSLLVTGCSSNDSTGAKYDQVDLIKYEECLKSNSDGLLSILKLINSLSNFDYQRVLDSCKKYEPMPIKP
jgi:hypothetical protein